jgi:hypothetical protein
MGSITRSFANLITANGPSAVADGSVTNADLAGSISTDKLAGNINFKNIIINGDMSIAQRGTSTSGVTTTDGYYACDRWYSQTDTGTWTISRSTDVPTGQGFINSFKMDCTSAGTSNADEVMIRSKHEGLNLQYLKYGTSSAESLTLSFWIKSNKTGNYYVAFVNNNSTQDRVISFGYSIDSADTWEKKTITIPGDTVRSIDYSVNEEFTIYWLFSAASAFTSGGVSNTWVDYSATRFANSDLAGLGGSTADEVYMTGVQLEAGTTASDFEFLPHDVNKTRCYRYYYRLSSSGLKYVGWGQVDNDNNNIVAYIDFKTDMRTAPTAVETTGSASNYQVREAITTTCDAVPTFNAADIWYSALSFKKSGITSSNGYAQGEILKCGINSGFLAWSTEL